MNNVLHFLHTKGQILKIVDRGNYNWKFLLRSCRQMEEHILRSEFTGLKFDSGCERGN